MDLKTIIQKIPLGSTEVYFNGKKYLVTRQDFNNGKSTKVYAEELGGNDFISFNFYVTSKGAQLKPCEMPKEKVLNFLTTIAQKY
ncbi:MAG: peptide methionine sulfoxide reductase [Bacteroidota bacterium]